MTSHWHLAIRIPLVLLYIIITPILTIFALIPMAIFETFRWTMDQRETISPPVMGPGYRWKDQKEAVSHALAKIYPHRQAKIIHTHGIDIPRELIDLLLSHLDPTTDQRTFLNCGLICPCWLSASRLHAFRTVHGDRKRAYGLMRLLRSPHCTFVPCIHSIILKDDKHWNVSDALLRHLVHSDITPQRLELQLHTSIIIPPRQASFSSQLTVLKIVQAHSAFGRGLSNFARFIAAFPVLQILDIDATIDFNHGERDWRSNPPSSAPSKSPHSISPHLRGLNIRHYALVGMSRLSHIHSYCDDVNLPYLIPQHHPKLESLTLVAPSNGYGPHMSTLADFFVAQAKYLKHLTISPPLVGRTPTVSWSSDELNCMIPVYSGRPTAESTPISASSPLELCRFSALRTLHLTASRSWFFPSKAIVDKWLFTLARNAPLLEEIMVTPWRRGSATMSVLENELGFVRSVIEVGVAELYKRVRIEAGK